MSSEEVLSRFFAAIARDPRISFTHISLFAALVQYRQEHGFDNPVQFFSHQIMRLAKISGTATYARIIRELDEYGYIRYEPSYNRNQGSKIYFPDDLSHKEKIDSTLK
jgi:hypothetical protein